MGENKKYGQSTAAIFLMTERKTSVQILLYLVCTVITGKSQTSNLDVLTSLLLRQPIKASVCDFPVFVMTSLSVNKWYVMSKP